MPKMFSAVILKIIARKNIELTRLSKWAIKTDTDGNATLATSSVARVGEILPFGEKNYSKLGNCVKKNFIMIPSTPSRILNEIT
jgi:hypothetical protein